MLIVITVQLALQFLHFIISIFRPYMDRLVYCTAFSIFVHLVALMFVGAGTTFLMSISNRTLTFSFNARRGERTAES